MASRPASPTTVLPNSVAPLTTPPRAANCRVGHLALPNSIRATVFLKLLKPLVTQVSFSRIFFLKEPMNPASVRQPLLTKPILAFTDVRALPTQAATLLHPFFTSPTSLLTAPPV